MVDFYTPSLFELSLFSGTHWIRGEQLATVQMKESGL